MFFDKFKSIFVNDMGIDLGTMNTLVYVANQGIVLSEPSVVAINADTKKVRAVGEEAKKMLGVTPENIRAIRPIRDGVIADAEVTQEMLRVFVRKCAGFKLMRPRILIAVPYDITEIAMRTFRESAADIGVRGIQLVEEPLAAAIGVGLPVNEPDASMIVDVGGGTSEAAVISLGSIVHCESVNCGGDAMDDAIIAHMKNEHNLLIGEQSAEKIKIQIGSAAPLETQLTMEVKGLDIAPLGNKRPRAVTVTSDEIQRALQAPIDNIIAAISRTLDNCKPELAGYLVDNGITMSGGGSLLRNFDKVISEATGLPVVVGKEPLLAVANGTGIMLQASDQIFSQPPNSLIGKGRRN